jgi:penicillin-binding protein 1A
MSNAPLPADAPRTSGLARLLGLVLNVILLVVVVGAGLGGGLAYGLYLKFKDELPRLEALAEYQPSELTTIYDRNGLVIDRFFLENRVVVPLGEVPQTLKNAFFAIEDSRFYEHEGIDAKGMLRALVKNVRAGRIVEGASTITQQLVRTMFLSRQQVYSRKLREMLLAWKLEQLLTKDQILEMYFNEIYLGSGAYGVEAAARTYFGKPVQELTLGECAVLASLPKAPESYSPRQSIERARRRQKMVLDKMAQDGLITRQQAQEAWNEGIELHERSIEQRAGLYFVEYVRQRVERELGSATVHRGGLSIYTTLDLELQRKAETALRKGLRDYDKRRGFRGPLQPDAGLIELAGAVAPGARLMAQVRTIGPKAIELDVLTTRSGRPPELDDAREEPLRTPGAVETASLRQAWSGKVTDKLAEGSVVLVKVEEVPSGGKPLKLTLEQEPEAEAALMSLDPFTGEVLAMVGGYDFSKSEFNRATQARRQPGSSFKLFIYLTALEQGLTPASVVYDTAVVKEHGGEDGKAWKPQNYYGKFFGKMGLREAMARSLNPVAVKLLEQAGIDPTIRNARRLGVTADLTPDLALGLGSSGVSLLEMTAAYGTMAAGGLYARPHFVRRILDREGRVIDEQIPQVHQATSPQLAYVMTRLLQGVVQNGTAKAARILKRPVAGKTGTTDNYHDAWFIGYSPDIVTGVWIGFDDMRRSLGRGETGGKAALPIWIDFMQRALGEAEPAPFPAPDGVRQARIDPDSGLLATPQCRKVFLETFVEGTVPVRHCDQHGVSADNFDQMDSVGSTELAAPAGPAAPVEALDPSEMTLPESGDPREGE